MLKLSRKIYSSLPAALKPPVRAAGRAALAATRRGYPRVFLTSVPKAGTHLLTTFLDKAGFFRLPDQPFNPDVLIDYDPVDLMTHLNRVKQGEYFLEHLVWREGIDEVLMESGIKTIFIYREPRAATVSFAHYVSEMHPTHRLHRYYKSLPDLRARIEATLDGVPDDKSRTGHGRVAMAELCDRFYPWLSSPAACCVSFEDLIRPNGGGTEEKQKAAVEKLILYLGLPVSSQKVNAIAESVFNPNSVTFRAPKLGGWRRDMDDETAEMLTGRLEKQIRQWGYEL